MKIIGDILLSIINFFKDVYDNKNEKKDHYRKDTLEITDMFYNMKSIYESNSSKLTLFNLDKLYDELDATIAENEKNILNKHYAFFKKMLIDFSELLDNINYNDDRTDAKKKLEKDFKKLGKIKDKLI